MKLHLDRVAFEQILGETEQRYGIRRDVLEKDYYVTLLLYELTGREAQGHAYFKGGTALYKALRSIRRFSEDIDLTVCVEDCPTPSQAQKRLKNAALQFSSLPKGRSINKKGSIVCEYLYSSLYELDESDALQRFGNVQVEATSFTISEPTTCIEIAPYLYELCNEDRKRILREYYDVSPFNMETISLERIFVDKVFAAEYYFERAEFDDVAKHIYDITVLLQNELILRFLSDVESVRKIVGYKRQEETVRLGGVDATIKIRDFSYFSKLRWTSGFADSYERMQNIYVLSPEDRIDLETAIKAVEGLQQHSAWGDM